MVVSALRAVRKMALGMHAIVEVLRVAPAPIWTAEPAVAPLMTRTVTARRGSVERWIASRGWHRG